MRIILALLLLAAPALAQPADIAHKIISAVTARPDAEQWLAQKKFTPNDAQRLLLAVRQNSIVATQHNLSSRGQETLSQLLAEIRSQTHSTPTHWSYVTHIDLPHPAMTVIGIVIPTSNDPVPPLKLRATSPSGRTTTKDLKSTHPITVLSLKFPYCNEDHTLCEDRTFTYAINP